MEPPATTAPAGQVAWDTPTQPPSGCAHGAERAWSGCFRTDWRGDSCGGSGDSAPPASLIPEARCSAWAPCPEVCSLRHLQGPERTQTRCADGDRGPRGWGMPCAIKEDRSWVAMSEFVRGKPDF